MQTGCSVKVAWEISDVMVHSAEDWKRVDACTGVGLGQLLSSAKDWRNVQENPWALLASTFLKEWTIAIS